MAVSIWLLSNTPAMVARDWLLWICIITTVAMETISKVIRGLAHINQSLATVTIKPNVGNGFYIGVLNHILTNCNYVAK